MILYKFTHMPLLKIMPNYNKKVTKKGNHPNLLKKEKSCHFFFKLRLVKPKKEKIKEINKRQQLVCCITHKKIKGSITHSCSGKKKKKEVINIPTHKMRRGG